jgi:hypothetical protein
METLVNSTCFVYKLYPLTVYRGCVTSTILEQLSVTPLESITGFQDLRYVTNLCCLRI